MFLVEHEVGMDFSITRYEEDLLLHTFFQKFSIFSPFQSLALGNGDARLMSLPARSAMESISMLAFQSCERSMMTASSYWVQNLDGSQQMTDVSLRLTLS